MISKMQIEGNTPAIEAMTEVINQMNDSNKALPGHKHHLSFSKKLISDGVTLLTIYSDSEDPMLFYKLGANTVHLIKGLIIKN